MMTADSSQAEQIAEVVYEPATDEKNIKSLLTDNKSYIDYNQNILTPA
ncbi:hypothetical protein [Sphingobacterium sp. SGR-19]|nr:hypothetical protein [Sphingobacterium sp. SGR-19]NGM66848.1 hypothetical protein [Sphingobacterium sp. SGR-19]